MDRQSRLIWSILLKLSKMWNNWLIEGVSRYRNKYRLFLLGEDHWQQSGEVFINYYFDEPFSLVAGAPHWISGCLDKVWADPGKPAYTPHIPSWYLACQLTPIIYLIIGGRLLLLLLLLLLISLLLLLLFWLLVVWWNRGGAQDLKH